MREAISDSMLIRQQKHEGYMALIIIALVVMFMTPIHPEKILLRRINRFFHACAAVIEGFSRVPIMGIKKSERNLCNVRMLPRDLFAVEQTLNYKLFPANAQSKINYRSEEHTSELQSR